MQGRSAAVGTSRWNSSRARAFKSCCAQRDQGPPGLSSLEARFITAEVLAALSYAHALSDAVTGKPLGIVHRDVSPENILIGYDGRVRLIDFGISISTDREFRTLTGQLAGRPRYMAPERAKGKRVDLRSDLFAVGIIYTEMLTGNPFYGDKKKFDILAALADGTIQVQPSKAIDDVARAVIERCLLADPEKRYRSAGAALDDLGGATLPRDLARMALADRVTRLFDAPADRAERAAILQLAASWSPSEEPVTTLKRIGTPVASHTGITPWTTGDASPEVPQRPGPRLSTSDSLHLPGRVMERQREDGSRNSGESTRNPDARTQPPRLTLRTGGDAEFEGPTRVAAATDMGVKRIPSTEDQSSAEQFTPATVEVRASRMAYEVLDSHADGSQQSESHSDEDQFGDERASLFDRRALGFDDPTAAQPVFEFEPAEGSQTIPVSPAPGLPAHATSAGVFRGTSDPPAVPSAPEPAGRFTPSLASIPDAPGARPSKPSAPGNVSLMTSTRAGSHATADLAEETTQQRQATRLHPTSATAWNRLGILLARQEDMDGAVEALTKALELAPGDASIRSNLTKVRSAIARKGSSST